jgi:hypothetical protein
LNSQFDTFFDDIQREGRPTSRGNVNRGACCFYKRGVVPDVIENGINGYSSKVKDFKDLKVR